MDENKDILKRYTEKIINPKYYITSSYNKDVDYGASLLYECYKVWLRNEIIVEKIYKDKLI